MVNADGSGRINLTNTPNRQEAQPAWSPDSVFISYSSRDSTTLDETNWDIFVVQADGENLRQITTNEGPDNSSWWIP